ncbi:hypothetical protein ACFY3V_09920 [Streptosporangium sp. NPDC000095]
MTETRAEAPPGGAEVEIPQAGADTEDAVPRMSAVTSAARAV